MSIYTKSNRQRNYRKIYEQNYGPIPKEPNGRTYDIHHIDGDHTNNNPTNLVAVTIEEHHRIHKEQGDHGAAFATALRMKTSPEELSELSRQYALSRIEDGTHPFVQPGFSERMITEGKNPFIGGEIQRRVNQERVDAGTHNFLGENNPSHERVENGTHNFLGDNNPMKKLVENGEHPWQGDGEYQRQIQLNRVAKGTHPFSGGKYQREMIENGTHPLLSGEHQRRSNLERMANGTHPSQVQWKCDKCGRSGKGKGLFTRWHGDNCSFAK